MKAAPAFQFYPQDFIVGCAMLTMEERGGYITLLCYQWEHFGIPNNVEKMSLLLGGRIDIWDRIKHKFKLAKDGLWKNDKMEEIRKKMDFFREKQGKNGAKGGKKTHKSYKQETLDLNQKSTQILPKSYPNDSQNLACDGYDSDLPKLSLSSSSSSSTSNNIKQCEQPDVVKFIGEWSAKFEVAHGFKYKQPSNRHIDYQAAKRLLSGGMSASDILIVAEKAWKLNGKFSFERSRSLKIHEFAQDFVKIKVAVDDIGKPTIRQPEQNFVPKIVREEFKRPKMI